MAGSLLITTLESSNSFILVRISSWIAFLPDDKNTMYMLILAGLGIRRASIAGGVVGMIGVIVLLSTRLNVDAQLRSFSASIGPLVLSMVIWVLIGLSLSVVASKLRKAE